LLPHNTRELVVDVISATLREVFAAHAKKRRDLGPLYVLIGLARLDGKTSVIRLGYDDEFDPHIEDDLQVIGWPSACEKLLAKLAEKEEGFLAGEVAWKVDIEEWALRIAGTLFTDVIEPGDERTVGGGVQVAILGPNSWKDLTVVRLGLRDIETAEWELISADPERLKSYRRQFNVPPLASGKFDIGFASATAKAAVGA
jgi:hypothetical protein